MLFAAFGLASKPQRLALCSYSIPGVIATDLVDDHERLGTDNRAMYPILPAGSRSLVLARPQLRDPSTPASPGVSIPLLVIPLVPLVACRNSV